MICNNASSFIGEKYTCNEEAVEGRKKCEKHLKAQREAQKKYNQRKRIEALNAYGAWCVCCEESNPVFLVFDHINNDGNIKRKHGRSESVERKRIQESVQDDIQVLCHNCNWAKKSMEVCPHKTRGDGNGYKYGL